MLDIGIVDHVQAMHTDKLILGLCKLHRMNFPYIVLYTVF